MKQLRALCSMPDELHELDELPFAVHDLDELASADHDLDKLASAIYENELASAIMAFSKNPPKFIDPFITNKFKGHYIAKTPLWAIQHCLKYEQLLPNWNSFYMKVRNHISIFEKY